MHQKKLQLLAAICLAFAVGKSHQYIIAGDGQFPYIVSMPYMDDHLCSGVILDEYHVLIPGWGHVGNFTFAILAGTRINKPPPGQGTKYGIEEFFIHPGYNSITQNNIGIVRLLRPLQFGPTIQPIEISSAYLGGGESVTVAGWLDATLTSDLMYDQEQTLTVQDCKDLLSSSLINDNVVCARSQDIVSGFHAFGSALIVNDKLAGVLNHYEANINIFVRLSSYLDWIKSIAYGLCIC